MKLIVTGACGFVGFSLIRRWVEEGRRYTITGLDNLSRPGAHRHREALLRMGVEVMHGDIRLASDLDMLPQADFVVDAAAQPSVLAGVDGRTTSRQVVEHNLIGTVNLLEYCRRAHAGIVLLSTSRVYSIPSLSSLPVLEDGRRYSLHASALSESGVGVAGVRESFSTAAPVSLYGATKLASETLALEYAESMGLPVWVNRCGVLAGAGQFGHAEQGIFSYWLHAWRARAPLRYTGFGGSGRQVRDVLHPDDLASLIAEQFQRRTHDGSRVFNVAGGLANSVSLRELSDWCSSRWGTHEVAADPTPRRFDLPWIVLDASRANTVFGFAPQRNADSILEEIAQFADANTDWLALSRLTA